MRFPLVARAGALTMVGAVLADARDGRGALLLVTGEPGVGKSRLAEEAAAQARDFVVVRAWCAPGKALRPWSQVVRALASAAGVRLSPLLGELAGTGVAARHGEPEADRWLLSLDLAELLADAALTRPVLIVLDDLHDADASTLRLLADLAPSLRSTATVVLATARDGDDDWQGRQALWGMLSRVGETIRLASFTAPDIARLLETAGGDPGMAAAILERTGGNPLLVCELIGSDVDPRGAVPSSVRAIAAARLAVLTDAARDVLRAAAVLGTEFGLDVLAEVAELPLEAVAEHVRAGGLVDAAAPGVCRVRHDLIRDAVYAGIPEPDRAAHHTRVANVLARRDVDAAQIAGHLLLAGPQALPAAADYAARAGDQALTRLAFEDAVQWYGQADRCHARAGSDADRARTAVSLGAARLATGDRAGARAEFVRAAALADRAGRADLLADAALGLSGGPAGFEVALLDHEQIELLQLARTRLGASAPALTALVTARLSIALTLVDSEQHRLDLAREAVRTARGCGDDVAIAGALAAECDAMAGPDHCAERRDRAHEIVRIAQRVRDPVLELLGRRLALVALLEIGDVAGADAEVRAYRAVATAVRHPLYLWFVPLWQGMRALLEGRFDDCRKALDEAAALGAAAGSANAAMLVGTQNWCLQSTLDDAAGIAATVTDFEALDIPGAAPQVTRGLLYAQCGRMDEARAQLDAVAPLLPALPRDSEWLASMDQLAETIDRIGAHPAAQWSYEQLRPYAELFSVEGIGAAVRRPVHRALQVLATAMGRDAAAAEHAAAADAAEASIGMASGRRQAQPSAETVFRRDGEYWTTSYLGVRSRLKDSKGLQDLARLLERPGTAIGALDLAAAGVPRPASADTGEVLDATARAAYRRRLRELDDEAAEADAAGDPARSTKIAAERDALVSELTAAYGLGGRVRRTGSPAERARTAVTARIKDAIRRITACDPVLGEHLRRSVRTGTFCVYDPAVPVRWTR